MSCAHNFRGVKPGAKGFTLIEVLVTFVILAVGVLGVVSLLVSTKASDYEAVQRARAVSIADNMLERIRTNPRGLTTYDIGLSDAVDEDIPASEPTPNCLTDTCTPDERADYDLWLLQQELLGNSVTFPGGADFGAARLLDFQSCITLTEQGTKTRSGQLTVLIQWQGQLETGDGVPAGGDVCGDGESAGTDPTRRAVVAQTFVLDSTEIGLP